MSAPEDPALAAGEREQFRVPVADGALVVTDRRVFRLLVDGTVVGATDRDRIADAAVEGHVPRSSINDAALSLLAAGTCWLAAYLLYPFAPTFDMEPDAADRMGVGGAFDAMRTAVEVAGYADDALAVLGVLVAVYAVAVIARARHRTLVLTRDDGETVRLRAPSLDGGDAERLRTALVE